MDEASLLECIISHRDERADGTIHEANRILLAPRSVARRGNTVTISRGVSRSADEVIE
jgi:hypothetical protein